jgi:hypothetical protein
MPWLKKFSAKGPSLGSVMFCVVTAPIPARAKAQRAATAGEEELTATANPPVRTQRAAMENVIGKSFRKHRTLPFPLRPGFVKHYFLTSWFDKGYTHPCASRSSK